LIAKISWPGDGKGCLKQESHKLSSDAKELNPKIMQIHNFVAIIEDAKRNGAWSFHRQIISKLRFFN
jgi:hypothetical protein